MPDTITYEECPVCKSKSIAPALQAKDYTVSRQSFSIWQCSICSLRFTQDAPTADAISAFYQSKEYISHSDTKQGIINRLYHVVRNVTLKQKRKLVESVTGMHNGSLLDIGAGTGAFANEMQISNWSITALEPDDSARENAKKNYGLTLQSSNHLFSLPLESFDAITLWHVLEHVHELHNYLQTFGRILKKNGALIIAVPNYTSYDASLYKEYWAAYDVPRHLYHFSPQSMKVLLSHYSFEIEQLKPMPFDAFYVSLLSEKYKEGKSNYAKAFFTGLRSNRAASGKPEKSSSVIYIAKKA